VDTKTGSLKFRLPVCLAAPDRMQRGYRAKKTGTRGTGKGKSTEKLR